jgi:hypothetical protein
MDDGARGGEKAINLGSIGMIGWGDSLHRQAPARILGYRNCADLPAAQKDEDEASHLDSRRHRCKGSVKVFPWQALSYPCFRRST